MSIEPTILLSAIVTVIAAVVAVTRLVLDSRMRQIQTSTSAQHLAPAEMAFLLRDGDMVHTLIVMSVDLIQRTVKQGTKPPLRPYEQQVWLAVKDFVKQLAEQKAGHLIPVSNIKNPVQWVVRYNALKKFVGETLRTVVSEVVKDPRNLRRYFSIAGVARLAVQMYSSSVRTAVERELHAELLRNGLLVTPSRRKQFANFALLLIPIAVSVVFLANYGLSAISVFALMGYIAAGLINATVLQVVASLPGFIPTYEEFARISSELNRNSVRLTLVRTILRTGRLLMAVVLGIFLLLLLAAQLAIAVFLLHISVASALPLLLAFTLLGAVIVRCGLDWHSRTVKDQASASALAGIAEAKSSLAAISPLNTLTEVMVEQDYDPTFSHLVAFYGIETLWLLS